MPVVLVGAVLLIGAWGFLQEPVTSFVGSQLMSSSNCHPSYVGRCLPIGPDIDCDQVGGTVRVVGPDVYRLDGDGDGEGCEPPPY